MKKFILLIISIQFNLVALFSQDRVSKEQIATYVHSQTEDNVRKLYNSNGYTVLNVIKGYPECLDGYVFYSDRLQMGGTESETFSPELKVFAIEKGKINANKNFEKLSCEIAFTLTAKDNNLAGAECLIFIGTNGFAYNYKINKLNLLIPIVLDIDGISFLSNTVKTDFRFSVSGNEKKEKNKSYDFSGLAIDLNCKVTPKPSIEWVDIPAGTFIMGSSKKEIKEFDVRREEQREITIDSFKISKYEITFEQYEQFCKATNKPLPDDAGWGKEMMPVINISFQDATDFATWMGCRLPSEAEWEYACRAGTTTRFSTGDCINEDQANFMSEGECSSKKYYKGKPVKIGSYAPNAWGLYDMHGNVAEWTCDAMNFDYNTNPQKNPIIPITNESLAAMIKGGAFNSEIGFLRSGARCHSPLYYGTDFRSREVRKYNWIGIRLVCK